MSDDGGEPYKVGYGRPPKHRQFKPGESGNKAGRRSSPKNAATIVREALNAKVKLKENGRSRSMSKLEVSIAQLANKAAGGDLRAIQMVLALHRDVEAEAASRNEQAPLDRADCEILDMLLERVRAAGQGQYNGE